MLPADARFISVDDHLVEPPHLWEDRLPTRLKERGPRLVRDKSGADMWKYEENLFPQMFSRSWGPAITDMPAGVASDDVDAGRIGGPLRYDEIRPGCYDPKARLGDMDRDGVYAQINFPTWPRFAGTRFKDSRDMELAALCVKAWNDFIFEEWCAAAPERYIPMVIVPFWDPASAAAEILRAADQGAKAVSFPENPAPLGLPSFHEAGYWDPFFASVQDAGLAVCLHFGSSGQTPYTAPDAPFIVTSALMGLNAMGALADLVFSPILRRFPRLRFVLSESGIGWIPYMVERLDQVWREHRDFYDIERTIPPSEVFRDHFWVCTITETFGMSLRSWIGADRILLESDYPHADSSWPNSRHRAESLLSDVPDDEATCIAEGNACEVFRLDISR